MAAAAVRAFEKLSTEFRQRRFAPLYLLYGEEGYFLDELQDLLVAHALQPQERDFNLDVFFGPDADVRHVLATCASYPMMAERRVVVVRSFEQLDDNRDFVPYAGQPNRTAVVLLLCRGKVNLATHPYRALKQHGRAVEFKSLYDNEMPDWVAARARTAGLQIDAGAAQLLAHEVGTDLRAADTEIEKLRAYIGDRTTIAEEDVLAVAGQERDYNIFELQRTIGQADRSRAMRIAARMIDQASNRQGEAIKIVSTLSWYAQRLRTLAAIQARRPSDAEIARHIGVPAYFAKEYRAALRQYGYPGVQAALQALLAADFELKGGSTRDPVLIVHLMLRRWMQPLRPVGTVVEQ